MKLPRHPDPERGLIAAPGRLNISTEPYLDPVTVGLLCRGVQVLGACLDARLSREEAYRELYRDIAHHSHAGTGSDLERRASDALDVLAAMLGVRNE